MPGMLLAFATALLPIVQDGSDELRAIVREHDQALAELNRELPQDEVLQALPAAVAEFTDRVWPIIEANSGTKLAMECLTWIALNTYEPKDAARVLEIAIENHIEDQDVGDLIRRQIPSEGVRKLVEAILDKSPHSSVRALACHRLGKYWATQLETENSEGALEKAVARFEQLAREFGDNRSTLWGHGTMATTAEHELFALRNLRVGMVAPDIEGSDLLGIEFKLSDYRGKVVVLDFWGDW